jgi:hypothetical protein
MFLAAGALAGRCAPIAKRLADRCSRLISRLDLNDTDVAHGFVYARVRVVLAFVRRFFFCLHALLACSLTRFSDSLATTTG